MASVLLSKPVLHQMWLRDFHCHSSRVIYVVFPWICFSLLSIVIWLLWVFLLPHSVLSVQRKCEKHYLWPNIPLHDEIHRKQKAKCWRDFKFMVNSLMAVWFDFSATCKGKASVDFSELARSGVAEPQNVRGIKENNSGYAELAFAPLRTDFSSALQGCAAAKDGQLLFGSWEKKRTCFQRKFRKAHVASLLPLWQRWWTTSAKWTCW